MHLVLVLRARNLVANRKVSSGFGVCLTLLKQGMLKRSGKNSFFSFLKIFVNIMSTVHIYIVMFQILQEMYRRTPSTQFSS